MTLIETGSLLVLAAVGFGITYFGYEATQALLRFGGMAAGAALGAWVGVVFVPQIAGAALTGTQQFAVAGVLVLIGAGIGQSFIPSLGRFAIVCLSFTLTAIATLVVISKGGALETVTQTFPRALERGEPGLFFDRLEQVTFIADLDAQMALLVVLGAAALGTGLALVHADFILTVIVTILGAMMLAAVVPLLLGEASLQAETVTSAFSEFWFLVFLVTGVVFEALRYSDEIDPSDLLGA